MSFRRTRRFIYILILLTVILAFFLLNQPDDLTVIKVMDGDTIKLANGERVRYIGVDTPELHHPQKPVEYLAAEAREMNEKLVYGKKVRLEFDVQERDRYGRLLAYVFVDSLFVNAWVVENGYAKVYTVPPNVKYAELFLKLEQEARRNKRGLWSR